ncbi:MAG: DUF5050 domain-containing protein [Armatimonadetes bacterium]|nr:DUF5050 domain-containing protein [Armatimonadota bacterium]
MSIRVHVMLTVLALGIGLVGCGGNGVVPGPGPDPEPTTVDLGAFEVAVASPATFQTASLNSPNGGLVGFTAMWGSRITRLRELGLSDIAFQSTRTTANDIYVMSSDGGNVRRLTNDGAADTQPAYSPDGSQICFTALRTANEEIFVMDADGSAETNLTNNAAADNEPDWSPKGTQVAFTSQRDGNREVYRMKPDGTSQIRVTNNAAIDFQADWSPNARQFAFSSDRGGDYEIYVMNIDGSNAAALTNDAANDFNPAWSPDGRKIAFNGQADGDNDIYVVNADGTYRQQLTFNSTDDREPSWSPDGRRIAFASNRDGQFQLYSMAVDGLDVRNLTGTGTTDQAPDWSPGAVTRRQLIGAPASDGGSDPPFGTPRPLAIVGMGRDGLVGAMTITADEAVWPTVNLQPMSDLGPQLAGARITAGAIGNVLEDRGRGLPPQEWTLSSQPAVGAVLVFFRADTGRIATLIAVSDQALSAPPQRDSGRIVLQGGFGPVLTADDGGARTVAPSASRVELDAQTGVVLSSR